jgi:flagellar hook-length control protein FliK
LAAQNISSAEIRLDPPELGPMQVKVALHHDQVSVNFTSPHALVRDTLDLQLNRLREMFAEQGMNLVNVDVSDKSFQQQERDAKGSDGTGSDQDNESHEETAVVQLLSQRLVDHYA